MYYNEDYKVELPEKNDQKYINIKNYDNFEYSNCIAYEMAIRTVDFKSIYKNIIKEDETLKYINSELSITESLYSSQDLDKILQELGLSIYHILYYINKEKSQSKSKPNKQIIASKDSLIIGDISDGISKLIRYFIQVRKIFTHDDKGKRISIEYDGDRTYKDIYSYINNPSNKLKYCIPSYSPFDPHKKHIQYQYLSQFLKVHLLEEGFLETLNKDDIPYLSTSSKINLSIPDLKFKESKIIDLKINLNLPKDELIAYISSVKDNYDKDNSVVKHPLEILGEKLDKSIEPNSLNKLPKNKEKRKVAFADALYIYDLYKILEPIFKDKQDTLRETMHKTIKEKRQSKGLDKDQKDSEIDDIKKIEQDEIKEYSKLSLITGISIESNISVDKIQTYLTLMNDYIGNLQYKELITRTSSK